MRCKACNKLLSTQEMRYVDYMAKRFGKMQFDDFCYTCQLISTDPDRAEYYQQGLNEVLYDDFYEPTLGGSSEDE